MPKAPSTHFETLRYLQKLSRNCISGTAANYPDQYGRIRDMLAANRQELLDWMKILPIEDAEEVVECLEMNLRSMNCYYIEEYSKNNPEADEVYISPNQVTPEALLRFEKWYLLQTLRFSRQIQRILQRQLKQPEQQGTLKAFIARQFNGGFFRRAPNAFRKMDGRQRIALVEATATDLPGLRQAIHAQYLDPIRFIEKRKAHPPVISKKRPA